MEGRPCLISLWKTTSRCSNFSWSLTTTSVCIKAGFEQIAVLYPREHQLNNIVLQKVPVVCCFLLLQKWQEKEQWKREREIIITLLNVDLSYWEITKRVKMSVSTVLFAIKRTWELAENCNRRKSGGPKATTKSEGKFLRVDILCDRKLTVQQLQDSLMVVVVRVSLSAVKSRLPAKGLTGRVAAGKLLLRCQTKTKRLAQAKKHRHWTPEDWKKVLWTSQSEFKIFF